MMSEPTGYSAFSLLPERRAPWREFVLSLAFEGAALFVLAWVAVLHPEVLVSSHDYHLTQLVETPPPVNVHPAPVRNTPAPAHARLETPSSNVLRIPHDLKPEIARLDPPVAAPKVDVAVPQSMPLEPSAAVIPRQLVKTNVFSTGSSESPTIARAPQQVQTGGFGDPNGVPAHDNNGKPVTIARMGSFDLPAGGGNGNGSGGARGVSGVVASAGFGNGTATGDGSGRKNTSRGNGSLTVQNGGFGDVQLASAQAREKPSPPAEAKVVPAQILSKPNPSYTDEARKMRIEGEVLLEVVFESSGRLHVNRIVRGLGHGLDDAAVHAAEQIRFKPAMRDGQPADSTAVLHIVFQLA